jgi:hypothetical protein
VKPFKAPPRFVRYGQGELTAHRMGRCRSFSTLQAAIRGVRLDVAELEADGVKLPLSLAVWYEHRTRAGMFEDSEIAAVWKRGRFVWVDSELKKVKP